MYALEASGEAFFQCTKEIAREAEMGDDIVEPLDYLGDRHEKNHIEDPIMSVKNLQADFLCQHMTLEQMKIAEEMIHIVFDSYLAQRSHADLVEKLFNYIYK